MARNNDHGEARAAPAVVARLLSSIATALERAVGELDDGRMLEVIDFARLVAADTSNWLKGPAAPDDLVEQAAGKIDAFLAEKLAEHDRAVVEAGGAAAARHTEPAPVYAYGCANCPYKETEAEAVDRNWAPCPECGGPMMSLE
jgi:hypothetical protein